MTDPVFMHPDLTGTRAGDQVYLPSAEARHAEVKRLGEGEAVVLTDGAGTAVRGHWRSGGVHVEEVLYPAPRRPRVTVVQALPKSERAELAVDLMVQAGADRIIPWSAQRCIARWDGKEAKAHAKWVNAAQAAAKQSRRLLVPEVTARAQSVAEAVDRVRQGFPAAPAPEGGAVTDAAEAQTVNAPAAGAPVIVVLDEEATTGLKSVNVDAEDVVLVVGPEGGITPAEREAWLGYGAQLIVLGPEVLRTASAAAVALGALGVLTSRWDLPR